MCKVCKNITARLFSRTAWVSVPDVLFFAYLLVTSQLLLSGLVQPGRGNGSFRCAVQGQMGGSRLFMFPLLVIPVPKSHRVCLGWAPLVLTHGNGDTARAKLLCQAGQYKWDSGINGILGHGMAGKWWVSPALPSLTTLPKSPCLCLNESLLVIGKTCLWKWPFFYRSNPRFCWTEIDKILNQIFCGISRECWCLCVPKIALHGLHRTFPPHRIIAKGSRTWEHHQTFIQTHIFIKVICSVKTGW